MHSNHFTEYRILPASRSIGVMEHNADHKEKGNEGEEKKDSVIPEFSIEYKRDV